MKQKILFIFVLLCMVAQGAWAQRAIDLSTITSNYVAQDGDVLTGTLGANVKISIAAGATVTLDGVTINGTGGYSDPWAGLTCEGNATIILKGTNTVKAFHANYPGIQAAHNTGSGAEYTLTIKGTGSLTASSVNDGAGIGGGKEDCGNIHILDGTITAIGGKYGAGIGSGSPTTCGTITIEGGVITAIGGYCGAGIGSGCGDWSSQSASCGAIKITSGVTSVTATKGDLAPNSIGKGKDSTCGTVTIGGKLYWDGSAYRNGGDTYLCESTYTYIPALSPNATDLATITENYTVNDDETLTGTLGANVKISIAADATVTLDGVTINGTGGYSDPWAGLTCEGNATIILKGTNTVKAFHANYPGIQAAHNTGSGAEYTLTIKGTGSLTASSVNDGAGIGGGKEDCGNIHILDGTITAIGGKYGAGIGSGSPTTCGTITIEGGVITAIGGYCGAGIGSGCGDWSSQSASCGAIKITSGVTSVTATKGDLAPNSIGKGKDSTCGTVTIGGKTGPISESPYTYYPSLDVSGDMTGDLEMVMGQTLDITFRGRQFIIDSEWNTLCLPFSMTAEQISNSPLANGRIVELDTEKTTLSDGVLTIAYKTATEIVAGKPYIVKWIIDDETEGSHVDNPIFKSVTISTSAPTAVSAAGITFTGTFAPLTLGSGDKTKLWLDDDVRLRWVSGQDEQVSPTWCYWNLGDLEASTLNAIVVTFDDGSRPIVELMDGMKDFSILSAFGEQEVNVSIEGRELSAVQQADGTWKSRAYTLCLPFYAELFNTGCDFTIYSKAEITQDGELLFTQEMLPFLYPGNAYLIVVNEGKLLLQENGVTLTAEADEADDDANGVLYNYIDDQIAGHWLGSLKTMGHDEAVNRNAFTMTGDGSFQRITDSNPTWQWPAFRAMFCATDLMTADKLPTKYQLDANGEEDDEDRSLPNPDSYQGDNDGEATGIAPVIHTIDRDGTEHWFDFSGRQLEGKPTQKGVYINKGNKIVIK